MDVFNQGATVHLETTVYNEAGTATNPVSLSLVYRPPSGSETTIAFGSLTDEAGAGVYSYDVVASEPGVWTYRWVSVTPSAVDEGVFQVRASAIAGGQAQGTGPCQPWCDPDDLTVGGWTLPTGVDTFLAEQACQAASEVCFELGGRRWPGLCWDSIIPQDCCSGSAEFVVLPNGRAGVTAVPVGARHPAGRCWGASVVDLGSVQVTAIDAVRVDGAAVAASVYRLIDRRWLARIDGASWPCLVDVTATTIAMEVDFTFGEAPPALGVFAAIALARELAKSLSASDDCAIDPRVTALVREGVSLTLSDGGTDAEQFLEIPAVRRFVETYNRHRIQRAASVIVPGQSTWPARIGSGGSGSSGSGSSGGGY